MPIPLASRQRADPDLPCALTPPQIEPEGVGSLNPDALIPNRDAQPDHPPPLNATRAENTPFGFPSVAIEGVPLP